MYKILKSGIVAYTHTVVYTCCFDELSCRKGHFSAPVRPRATRAAGAAAPARAAGAAAPAVPAPLFPATREQVLCHESTEHRQ